MVKRSRDGMKVLAFVSRTPNILEDSQGNKIAFDTLKDAFDFLYTPFEGFKVTGNLDTFIAPVLRLFKPQEVRELQDKGGITLTLSDSKYKIRYFPEKFFQVRRYPNKHEAVFYHLDQYGEAPEDLAGLQSFGEQIVTECTAMGFYPHNLTSAIGILQTYLEKMDIPTFLDIDDGTSEYAQFCGNRQWVEAHKVGYFPQCYDYDLSAAFSKVHASLLDFRRGRFTKLEGFDPTATYGYCRCKVNIYDHVTVSPIVYRDPKATVGILSCPTGEWPDYRTKEEIDFIQQYHLGEVKVYDGHYWHPDPKRTQVRPLEILISRLWRAKASGIPLRASIAKMMLVGLWGKTGQYNDKTDTVGKFFNPPWRAEFTSRTSLNVARMLYRHKAMPDLIHVVTDGVLLEKPVTFSEAEVAAGWKTNYEGDAIVVSSGLVYYSGKHPKSLYMGEVRAMIEENLLGCRWKKHHTKVVTLGEAIEWNALDQLGLEHDYIIPLDLSLIRHNRNFEEYPTTGRQLLNYAYDSVPYKVGGV